MRADDYTFCTYRGHNHTLARGVPMAPIFAELFGRFADALEAYAVATTGPRLIDAPRRDTGALKGV